MEKVQNYCVVKRVTQTMFFSIYEGDASQIYVDICLTEFKYIWLSLLNIYHHSTKQLIMINS